MSRQNRAVLVVAAVAAQAPVGQRRLEALPGKAPATGQEGVSEQIFFACAYIKSLYPDSVPGQAGLMMEDYFWLAVISW